MCGKNCREVVEEVLGKYKVEVKATEDGSYFRQW